MLHWSLVCELEENEEDCVLTVGDYINFLGAHRWWWILAAFEHDVNKTMAICESVQVIVGYGCCYICPTSNA